VTEHKKNVVASVLARLPELDFPRRFRWPEVRKFVTQVKSESRRSFLADRIEALRTGR
jgi:hypothetical protein